MKRRRPAHPHEEAIPIAQPPPAVQPPNKDIEGFLIETIAEATKRRRMLRREARHNALIALKIKGNASLEAQRETRERQALNLDARWEELNTAVEALGRLFSAHTGRQVIDLHLSETEPSDLD